MSESKFKSLFFFKNYGKSKMSVFKFSIFMGASLSVDCRGTVAQPEDQGALGPQECNFWFPKTMLEKLKNATLQTLQQNALHQKLKNTRNQKEKNELRAQLQGLQGQIPPQSTVTGGTAVFNLINCGLEGCVFGVNPKHDDVKCSDAVLKVVPEAPMPGAAAGRTWMQETILKKMQDPDLPKDGICPMYGWQDDGGISGIGDFQWSKKMDGDILGMAFGVQMRDLLVSPRQPTTYRTTPVTLADMTGMWKQLLLGLWNLQKHWETDHNDLKFQNILVRYDAASSPSWQALITDFGFAEYKNTPTRSGTMALVPWKQSYSRCSDDLYAMLLVIVYNYDSRIPRESQNFKLLNGANDINKLVTRLRSDLEGESKGRISQDKDLQALLQLALSVFSMWDLECFADMRKTLRLPNVVEHAELPDGVRSDLAGNKKTQCSKDWKSARNTFHNLLPLTFSGVAVPRDAVQGVENVALAEGASQEKEVPMPDGNVASVVGPEASRAWISKLATKTTPGDKLKFLGCGAEVGPVTCANNLNHFRRVFFEGAANASELKRRARAGTFAIGSVDSAVNGSLVLTWQVSRGFHRLRFMITTTITANEIIMERAGGYGTDAWRYKRTKSDDGNWSAATRDRGSQGGSA